MSQSPPHAPHAFLPEQPRPEIKLGVVFLRRKRPGFDPEWGAKMEELARTQLDSSRFACFIPEVRVVDDASLREALAACLKAGCDVLVALQTTMSDGRLAPVLGQVWPGPVVLWATPEKQEGAMISACSLVGAHTFAATLRQLGRPFELAYGMPGALDAVRELEDAVHVAYAVRRFRQGRVGLVGYHAPGFIDMHSDPFLLNRQLGVQHLHVGIREFLDRLNAIPDAEAARDAAAVQALGLPAPELEADDLHLASRFYLAMTTLMDEENLDALAVRDWTELSDGVGQWPYLGMARMSTEGRAVGCEGDVDGALSCLAGTALGCGAAYLSDWLEHDRTTVTLWHAGMAPFQLLEAVGSEHGPVIGRHFNNHNPAVVDGRLRAGVPLTIYRLWHCDGEYRMTTAEGESEAPRRELKGTNGLLRVEGRDVHAWFDRLLHAGLPHHPAVVEGRWGHRLRRFARQFGMTWVE
ncbi:MAG: sugar isomerase [Kiritimatiellaeota bacterium]|nr:sugar isomerase [Kiritimatiellota bacterium]